MAGVALNSGFAYSSPNARTPAPITRFHAPRRTSGRARTSAAATKCRMPNQMKRGPKTIALPSDTSVAAAAISTQRRQKSRVRGFERRAQHEPDADQQQELRHDRSPPADPGLIGQHAELDPPEVVQVINKVVHDHLRDRKAAQNVDDGQAGGGVRHWGAGGGVDATVRCCGTILRASVVRASSQATGSPPI